MTIQRRVSHRCHQRRYRRFSVRTSAPWGPRVGGWRVQEDPIWEGEFQGPIFFWRFAPQVEDNPLWGSPTQPPPPGYQLQKKTHLTVTHCLLFLQGVWRDSDTLPEIISHGHQQRRPQKCAGGQGRRGSQCLGAVQRGTVRCAHPSLTLQAGGVGRERGGNYGSGGRGRGMRWVLGKNGGGNCTKLWMCAEILQKKALKF